MNTLCKIEAANEIDRGLEYILITPARNEEATIEKTLQSVVAQTQLPKRWIIVSDGSTDRTDDIVRSYTAKHGWIELIRMPERRDRSFAAKAICFNAAWETVKGLSYDLIANVDADISFEADFFEFLLHKIAADPTIGVAGTRYVEGGRVEESHSSKDVGGQCQVFRRECLEQIGGYSPSRYGGVDWIAVRMARMNSWKTICFSERVFVHHRIMSSAEANRWVARIRTGRKDYILGNHPLWETFRVLYQMTKRPYIVGGILLLYGYLRAALANLDRPISPDLMDFHRREQIGRLKLFFRTGSLKMFREQ